MLIYNAFNLINIEVSEHPLASSLFNMIIFIGIHIIIFDRNDIDEIPSNTLNNEGITATINILNPKSKSGLLL